MRPWRTCGCGKTTLAGVDPVERAQAKLPKSPMGISIADINALPARLYEPGTKEFRYWTAVDALRRGVLEVGHAARHVVAGGQVPPRPP